ncbi:TIGR03086 family metal-binding protein [Streptomyces sp. NPDC008079]|uniref:TIGR03086 family metal-binding protein n=1 Tax=Streptomyces sp. NPDC008079 TaxID=3364806 RepID=UPI0036EB0697
MNFHAQIADSAAEAARVAAGITDDQLTGPTPCPDYDTRTLINHWVAYTGLGMELRARKEPHPADLGERDFTAEPGWAAAYARQLDRAADAWADPAAWEGELDMGGMAMPAKDIAGMLFMELLLHGWDVAKATGQEFRADEKSGALLLAVVREQAEMFRQYKGFAEPVEPPAGATDFETAVALSGRDPYWAA